MEKILHALIPSIVIGALVAFLCWFEPFTPAPTDACALELDLSSPVAGKVQVSWERGPRIRGCRAVSADLPEGPRSACRFFLPPGRFTSFAVKAPSSASEITVHAARIRDFSAGKLWQVPLPLFHARASQTQLDLRPDAVTFRGSATLDFPRPLQIGPQTGSAWALVQGAAAALLTGLVLWKFDAALLERRRRWCASIAAEAARRPVMTIAAAAAVAVIVACHPVIFLGKSYVSPNNGAAGLYPWLPLPVGGQPGTLEISKGSDVGAMAWTLFPYAVVQHEAIFRNHEVPLWNRYSDYPLLAQGQSMLGDPLHWIAICAGGAPWAWDLRFVLARFLFALGIGLLVREVSGRLGIAALLASSSAFIGFFAYRLNHPACFTMGYAPWILLAWWKIARAAGWRAAAPAAAMLVLANIFILNSGTAKESVMLIACLNAVGALAVFLMTPGTWQRWQRLAVGGVGLVLFVLLSAPCWLLFLDALPRAFTLYDHPSTFQISPALLIGLFDELFYRQTAPLEMHSNPSANFLVLLGVLWTAAASRRMWKDRGCRTLVLGAAPAFLLAFGVVPPSLITRLPFLCNVSHVDNTFSCVLIVLSFPLAGLGLCDCFFPGNARQWRRDGRIALGLMLALACLYFGFQQAHPRIGPAPAEIPAFPEKSAFFAGYATALFAALAALLWARSAWRRGTTLGPLLTACVALAAIHFRHGIYPATKFDDYVVNLQDRIDLLAPSPAVQALRRMQTEPGRVLGIGEVLPPGFNCALRLESPAHAEALISRYWRDFIEKSGVPVIWGWRVAVRAQELAALRPFLDFLNVRYYLGVPGEMPATPAGYQSLGMADLQVISSPGAWPRAFFTDSLARYRTTEEFVRLVAGGDGRPFAAVAENEPAAPRLRTAPAERQVVPATSYRLTSNSTEFTIEAPGPGVALLGETFEANCFRVSVNGQPAECFRANHLFKSIALPRAGRYVIRFTYEPAVWRIALAMSGAGTVLALIALIVSMSRRSTTNLRNAQPGIPRRRERPELVAS